MPKFRENVPLSKYSNYKIGGPARYFFEAKTEKEITWAVKEARARDLPVFILGGGTNLLINDKGWEGLVLRPALSFTQKKGTRVKVGAGVAVADLLKFTAMNSLSGLEWAGGLPGTVGGGIRGNAGCFGGEMKDTLVSVRSLDTKTMKIVERSAKACRFGYRESIFKKMNGKEIILDATFALAKGDPKVIKASIAEKIQYRKERHPLEYPNIGSIFRNVPLEDVHKKGSVQYKKALKETKVNFRGSAFSVKTDPKPVLAAAKFISEAGLRGVSFGGAMISPKHTNFIVNVLGAGSPDVLGLMRLAKGEVKRKFGVDLEEEVQIL